MWPLSWFRVCLAERSRRRACVWACPSTLRAVTDSECTQPGGFPGRGGSGSVGVPRRASRPRSRFARAVCHCHHTHIPWSQDLSTLALRTSRPPSSTQRPPRASAWQRIGRHHGRPLGNTSTLFQQHPMIGRSTSCYTASRRIFRSCDRAYERTNPATAAPMQAEGWVCRDGLRGLITVSPMLVPRRVTRSGAA